ncbi:beta-1,4-galactosyltransferase galt-1-like [Porites lutea]|uniref:beta-1,4-galactosyltransferase galt-1-like n=1 Tax=Porites lutea TaxID=51062 RepID=UPI003CC6D155
MLSSFSPYVFISDRIPKPNERLANLKEGANATIEAKNCSQTTDILPDFIECKRGTLLYSAWFGDRHAQNYSQVLLMTSRSNQPPPLSCRFQNGPTSAISVRAVTPYYEINKRYSNKRYGLFVASCILSKDLVGIPNFAYPILLTLITNECTVVLPVGNTRNTSYKRDYGICIPPMFGNIRVAEEVEFREMSQLLGASHFTFYDYSVSDSVSKMLSYYERKGVAQVLPWNVPTYTTDQDVHYYGQIFSMQDCLFRSINRLNFVAFNDLDEFITPFESESMPSLLNSITTLTIAATVFQAHDFPL